MGAIQRQTIPFIGSIPFEREHENIFFGRNEEAQKLLSLILVNKIVILYGKSGAGKTSLLNAKMEGLLEREDFRIFRINNLNINFADDTYPENVYVYSTALALTNEKLKYSNLSRINLIDLLMKIDRYIIDRRFIFIFDQFEEIFSSHTHRWLDRKKILEQIQEVCDKYPKSRIVMAIREDFLGRLNEYSTIWKRNPYYFHLELLNKTKSLSAIEHPVELTNRRYDKGVPDKIIDELLKIKVEEQDFQKSGKTSDINSAEIEGEYVEPIQLQIVCKALWESLNPEDEIINISHLHKIGGVEKVLEEFYEASLKKALKNHQEKEKIVRDWIELELITPIKTRDSFLHHKIKDIGIDQSIVDSLLDSTLIRIELRAGARWLSLSHDRFIEAILNSNIKWKDIQIEKEKQVQRKKRKFIYLSLGTILVFAVFISTYIIINLKQQTQSGLDFINSKLIDIITSDQVYPYEKLKFIEDIIAITQKNPESILGKSLVTLKEIETKEIEKIVSSDQQIVLNGMVFVPSGLFLYGDFLEETDSPVEVYLWSFYVDQYPVTNAEYQKFLYNTRGGQHGPYCHPDENKQKKSNHEPKFWGELQYAQYSPNPEDPVVFIDWYDAYAYAKWAGKRLPTEQEWEKAARGLYGRKYPWGYLSNYDEISLGPFPTDQKLIDLPSPFGCYDMIGKIWQWTNSEEKTEMRIILRGAPYKGEQLKDARITIRNKFYPGYSNYDIGFRCVKGWPK